MQNALRRIMNLAECNFARVIETGPAVAVAVGISNIAMGDQNVGQAGMLSHGRVKKAAELSVCRYRRLVRPFMDPAIRDGEIVATFNGNRTLTEIVGSRDTPQVEA